MDLLVEQPPQADRIEPEPRRLRPYIRGQVECAVGVEVGMTIEAGHAHALIGDLAVFGLIEFFLRKRREQQTQALHLHRRDDAVHQLIEILDR